MSSNIVKHIIRKICQKIVAIGSPLEDGPLYSMHEIRKHFHRCIGFIAENGVEGDLLEFGIAGGHSLALINQVASELMERNRGLDYRVFGFDSFEGLPEPTGIDKEGHLDGRGVQFNKGAFKCEKDRVMDFLQRQKAGAKRIHLVEGWYDKVLTPELRKEHKLEKAALINIDCDFYESTKTVLDWCEPLIQQGTIISFDDWYCYKASPRMGEMRAFAEFLEKHPDISAVPYSSYNWHGLAFCISRE